jgi:hypothetical protein
MKEGRRLDGPKMKRRGRRCEFTRTMNNQGEELVVVCALSTVMDDVEKQRLILITCMT